jgi:hypothetical protein
MSFTSQPKDAIKYSSKYVSQDILNKVPTQEAQAPNRKGNISKMPPQAGGARMATVGATNVSANTIRVAQPSGAQGAPKATGTVHGGNGKCEVKLSRPEGKYATNDGYLTKVKQPWKV